MKTNTHESNDASALTPSERTELKNVDSMKELGSPTQNNWHTLVFPPTGLGKSFLRPGQFARPDGPN